MGFPLEKTPVNVNIRMEKRGDVFHIQHRIPGGWESIKQFEDRNEALGFFVAYFENDAAKWSLNVKVRAGWVCEFPGCREIDRTLLESHHINPKREFPELKDDPKNGKCYCMWHHAWVGHKDNEGIRNKILARLCTILVLRQFPRRKEECQTN